MVTELPARRDLCDDYIRQATLVDFRGSNLSDAGSIPAISTTQKTSYQAGFLFLNLSLDNYIRYGYSVPMVFQSSIPSLSSAIFPILLILINEENFGYGI